ncbi:TIGR03936 family radical SAM-associated protein, partial [Chloroflexota bacterium]
YISHLDLMRLWQRVLHRARISLAYTEGFSPHPRISLAAPLSVGMTSEAELMDVFVDKWISPHYFATAVSHQLPTGINILQVYQVGPSLPSLQSQVRFAEYVARAETEKGQGQVESAVNSLLALDKLPWQHRRDTGVRSYDLRALIADLWLIDWRQSCAAIGMKLRCDSAGSGRPEQVFAALSLNYPHSIHRTKLILG